MSMIPGRKYTKAQMRSMMSEEYARALQYKGYVLQVDDRGLYSLVHHSKAFGGQVLERRKQGDLEGTLERSDVGGTAQFEAPAPIRKRTPQERLDSFVQKLWPEVKSVGHIPGLKEDDILTVVLNAKGRAEQLDLENKRMTAEDVRQVAASLLTQSEKEHEEKLSHQITRHED
jgi:hypothetical protein